MKKILFFTYDFPYPITSGGKNRAYHMLKYGAKNAEIHLFSFTRSGFKKEYIKELEKIGIRNITVFERKNASKAQFLAEFISKPRQSIFKSLYFSSSIDTKLTRYMIDNSISILHAESFYTGFYITDQKKKLGIKQIYGSENVEHLLYKEFVENSVRTALKPFYNYQVKKIKNEEQNMAKGADICIAVSEEDGKKIKKLTDSPVSIIDNGIDTQLIRPLKKQTNSKKILFVGNFSYFPNVSAIETFYKEVFVKIPGLELVVVGKDARKKLSFTKDPRISIHNFVENLADVYKDAFAFVFPIRFGGGTNFKILEAMAYGLPIVGFPDKMKSIRGITGKDYFSVDSFESMEYTLRKLMNDQKKAITVSEGARKVIEDYYSWGVIGNNLSNLWNNL